MITLKVSIYRCEESNSFWANSADLTGLAATGATIEEVQREAQGAAEALFETIGLQVQPKLEFQLKPLPDWLTAQPAGASCTSVDDLFRGMGLK